MLKPLLSSLPIAVVDDAVADVHRRHPQRQKNVNKFVHIFFLLAEKLFNIVVGNLFPDLLTQPNISPGVPAGTFYFREACANNGVVELR
ncbi:MAG: hypothetical protein EOP50_11875 [Sphingobacteriales bacterium]|nr:MAG: hypothetical protein EOP50_11875 [Sphingobacteriales bacterium]